MARRDTYDPFAPPTPPFPETRLRRARIPVAAISHLRERYDDLSQAQAVRFALSIRQQADGALRHRFTLPQDLTGLQGLTLPVLRDLAVAQGVGVSGSKDELVERITTAATGQPSDSQGDQDDDGDQEGQGDEQPPAETPTEPPAEQPAQEPASTPAPQPDGTGETITVETTSEPVTDSTSTTDETPAAPEQPAPADTVELPAAVVGTPAPDDVPTVENQAVVTDATGAEHTGTLPAELALDVNTTPAQVEQSATSTRSKTTASRPRSQS